MAAVPPPVAAPLPWEEPGRPAAESFLETLRLIALEPSTAGRRCC